MIPWVLGSELCIATVMKAPTGKGVITSFKFPCHLFVSGTAPGHQYHVEPRQAEYWYSQYGYKAHKHNSANAINEKIFEFYVVDGVLYLRNDWLSLFYVWHCF